MARIRTYKLADSVRVKVTGRLTASDIGRLEHACAPALTTQAVALDIDLSGVTESDDTADHMVHRMAERGAHVTHPPRRV